MTKVVAYLPSKPSFTLGLLCVVRFMDFAKSIMSCIYPYSIIQKNFTIPPRSPMPHPFILPPLP
jgi:hypothetical protein